MQRDAITVKHAINAPDPSAQPVLSATSMRLLPWLIAVAFFMESLDTTILNTAVPTIAAALHVAPLSMKSVLASYTLSLAVFIPISGWMADRFGRRRVPVLYVAGGHSEVHTPRRTCPDPGPRSRSRSH